MNEPTAGGNQTPDPDQDQDQDQDLGSVFSDPTAPVWVDPTAPVPMSAAPDVPSVPGPDTPPGPPDRPGPPVAPGAHGKQPAAPQGSPPAAPPMSNPYAQQPPVQQYGQQPPAHGQQPPTYGPQAPPYGQQPYGTGAPSETNVSAIVLTILSGISILMCNPVAIASGIVGIIALTKNSTDPTDSRRLANIGWIIFAVAWTLGLLVFIGLFFQRF